LKNFASQLRRRERWVQNSVSHCREGGGSGIGDVNKCVILFDAAPMGSSTVKSGRAVAAAAAAALVTLISGVFFLRSQRR